MVLALVTGASSGIGKAIAVQLSRSGISVLAVARRADHLTATQAAGAPGLITPVPADVTTPAGLDAIASAVAAAGGAVDFVVQNAGAIGQIGPAAGLDADRWRETFAVNVDAPLRVVQQLVGAGALGFGARVLHIGSGAAAGPMDGWAAYCCSKSAFLMLARCLQQEMGPRGVLVGSVKPGIVESPMQEAIRGVKPEEMSMVSMFQNLKKNEFQGDDSKPHVPPSNGLDTAANAAFFVEWLLTKASDEKFPVSSGEWDIRDAAHHHRWIEGVAPPSPPS